MRESNWPERSERTSDSCYVNLHIRLVKNKFPIKLRISLEIGSSELPLVGYKFIF